MKVEIFRRMVGFKLAAAGQHFRHVLVEPLAI